MGHTFSTFTLFSLPNKNAEMTEDPGGMESVSSRLSTGHLVRWRLLRLGLDPLKTIETWFSLGALAGSADPIFLYFIVAHDLVQGRWHKGTCPMHRNLTLKMWIVIPLSISVAWSMICIVKKFYTSVTERNSENRIRLIEETHEFSLFVRENIL